MRSHRAISNSSDEAFHFHAWTAHAWFGTVIAGEGIKKNKNSTVMCRHLKYNEMYRRIQQKSCTTLPYHKKFKCDICVCYMTDNKHYVITNNT